MRRRPGGSCVRDARLRCSWGALDLLLGRSWDALGASWDAIGTHLGTLGLLLGAMGTLLASHGVLLGALENIEQMLVFIALSSSV